MTIQVENGATFQAGFGAAAAGRPRELVVRDVICPEGNHAMTQHWTVEELRQLLDAHAPVFHCETHAYKWNPDDHDLQELRSLCNAIDGRY